MIRLQTGSCAGVEMVSPSPIISVHAPDRVSRQIVTVRGILEKMRELSLPALINRLCANLYLYSMVQASENGTIQLYKKMQAENLAREAEIAELRDRLNRQPYLLILTSNSFLKVEFSNKKFVW